MNIYSNACRTYISAVAKHRSKTSKHEYKKTERVTRAKAFKNLGLDFTII